MSDLTLADFHDGHCVGEYACEWAGPTPPNLCPLASDENFTTYRRLVAEWTPPTPQAHRSLADDPQAVKRAAKIVLVREPCPNCDGKGFDTVQSTRGPYATDDLPCPSCSGSGTTWPDELIDHIGSVIFDQWEATISSEDAKRFAAAVLDALVVQEGTDT